MKQTSRMTAIIAATVVLFSSASMPSAVAADEDAVYPAAILAFQERGRGVEGHGQKVQDILFANLAVNPQLYLVEREDLDKILDETTLNLSGMVKPDQATRIGQLTGAKIMITGSVLEIGGKMYVVAKIIGTETSRVLGASVKGSMRDDLDDMITKLAGQVGETIISKADTLVAKPKTREDIVADLKAELGDTKRPAVYVTVQERHVGQATIDPAAEIELTMLLRETGFEVIDPETGERKHADIVITGEGFSEFASRRKDLISVKARLELKAVDPDSEQIIVADRQTAVEVDLAEQMAGKSALQEAARQLAIRILPKLVRK